MQVNSISVHANCRDEFIGARISTQKRFADSAVCQWKLWSGFFDDSDRVDDWRPDEKNLTKNYQEKACFQGATSTTMAQAQ